LRGGSYQSFGMLALFMITGAVLGGILGEIIGSSSLGGMASYLVKTYPIFDIPPVVINLYVVKLVVGLALHPSLISIAGVIVAIFLFRRL
jgi:hypothetical protein